MTPMLLALALSAPPAEPIVPALVPSVAVAGAAVVLGTDTLAGRMMYLLDRNGPLADRLAVPVLDDARRWMSIARAFPKPRPADQQRAKTDAELAKLLEDGRRLLDESRRQREEMQRQLDEYKERAERFRLPRDPLQPWMPLDRPAYMTSGSLSLIVPASHIHPVIRRELGWVGPVEPWPPRR